MSCRTSRKFIASTSIFLFTAEVDYYSEIRYVDYYSETDYPDSHFVECSIGYLHFHAIDYPRTYELKFYFILYYSLNFIISLSSNIHCLLTS